MVSDVSRAGTVRRLVISQPSLLQNQGLIRKITTALTNAELFLQAGQVYEAAGDNESAMANYRKANAYSTALQLARYSSPKREN